MKRIGVTVLTILVVAVMATPEDELITGTRAVTGKLYKELIKNKPNENVIFSSISVQIIMSILLSASQRENYGPVTETRTVLQLPYGEENRQAAFTYILDALNKTDDDFKTITSNKMYFASGYSVLPWYRNIVENVYKSETESINFRNTASASQIINKWVADKTDNKIQEIVGPNELPSNTRALLINTLYLSAKWDRPFKPENNTWENFNGSNGPKRVEMMKNFKTYEYYADDNAQYLKLGLVREGGGADMVLVLPKEQKGLAQLENNIENLLKPVAFVPTGVVLTLPKFSFSKSMKLIPILQNIGVRQIFVPHTVKLEGLNIGLFARIDEVFQKSYVGVDEWGVTLSAGSGTDYSIDAPDTKVIFKADHPFMFYITVDDAVAFAGRVMQI